MWPRLFTVATCVFSTIALLFTSHRQTNNLGKDSASPLEIRLAGSPHWEKDCLDVSMDRINRSSVPLFLPVKGLYIAMSVNEVSDTGKKREARWINVFGLSDIGIWEAAPLAPGATVHDEKCLYPEVAIVNLETQTRRLIPLRGRLEIDAYYFLTKDDWQNDKRNHEDMFRTKPGQWDLDKIARHGPKLVSVQAVIPCRDTNCVSSCDAPPLVLAGEGRVVPDVFDLEPDWGARGTKISEDLARDAPECSGSSAAPH
jgi:hypothetical protein